MDEKIEAEWSKSGEKVKEEYTRDGVKRLDGNAPLYSGLFISSFEKGEIAAGVEASLAGGAEGISIFDDASMTDERWKELGEALKN